MKKILLQSETELFKIIMSGTIPAKGCTLQSER